MGDNAEIIGDGVAPVVPLFRQTFGEKVVDGLGELGEGGVEGVVGHLAVHDAP